MAQQATLSPCYSLPGPGVSPATALAASSMVPWCWIQRLHIVGLFQEPWIWVCSKRHSVEVSLVAQRPSLIWCVWGELLGGGHFESVADPRHHSLLSGLVLEGDFSLQGNRNEKTTPAG